MNSRTFSQKWTHVPEYNSQNVKNKTKNNNYQNCNSYFLKQLNNPWQVSPTNKTEGLSYFLKQDRRKKTQMRNTILQKHLFIGFLKKLL